MADLERALPSGIALARTALPDVPEISLLLLDPACLDRPLSGDGANAAHAMPPYWALAWASGQVLARYLLDHPKIVCGKRVADFGTGSGLVAIAAALAGAAEVTAIDRDPVSLIAASRNAEALGLTLSVSATLDARYDVLLAADVLYDAKNAVLLDAFRAYAEEVIVAESRFPALPHEAYTERFAKSACTYPDIDESETLKHVRIFESGSLGRSR